MRERSGEREIANGKERATEWERERVSGIERERTREKEIANGRERKNEWKREKANGKENMN